MSLLIFSYRRQMIIQRKSQINFQLMNLRQKLMDLQSYATSIADGTVSLNDLMKAPASQFNRMSIFMMYSHQASMAGASQSFAAMQQAGMLNQAAANNPALQNQYAQTVFTNLYNQQREKFLSQEKAILNEQDKKIEQQVAQLETQLQMLESEEKTVSEAETKAAENSAPKYQG